MAVRKITCPDCDGTGKVKYVSKASGAAVGSVTCPRCGGEGKIDEWVKKPFKLFVHGDTDSLYEAANEMGLTQEQRDVFRFSGSEVKFDGYVDERGRFWAEHVNGVALTKPVEV